MKTYRQLRTRLQRLRRRNKTAGLTDTVGTYEVFAQQSNIYQRCGSAQQAAAVADELALLNPMETFHVWSPDQQHAYEVKAMPERRAGYDSDESVAAELVMHVDNTEQLYRQKQYIEEGLANKMAAGRFDPALASKAYMGLLKAAAQSYIREFGSPGDAWHQMFPMNIRKLAAKQLFEQFADEVEINPQDFAGRMPKKHLPEWENRYRRSSTNNRAKRLHNKGSVSMPRKPSRRRRQRLANRIEQARSNRQNRDRNRQMDRRAERVDSKEERLNKRVASLTKLLRRAERELRKAQQQPQQDDLQESRQRIAELRKRLEQERRPVRRAAARSRRVRSRLARRSAERPIRRKRSDERVASGQHRKPARPQRRQAAVKKEAAPKVIRRKQDGKLYVRVD